MERNAFLIHKKIHQYILPGVLMTVAMQLGNVVDGMIVGNLLGPDAMAAIELSMPVLLLLQMPALTLAMGGAAEAAVFLGKRKMEEAGGVFMASLAAGAAISIFFALFTPFLPGMLSYALAGNERMAALVTDAMRAQYLEGEGYRTQILEFIDMEHTPKNILIRAVRTGKRKDNRKAVCACEEMLHISPLLGRLLSDEGRS